MTTVERIAFEAAHVLVRVRAEFNEMPGMRLTLQQAARLWDMPESRCERLLEQLVSAGFLVRDRAKRYARRPEAR